MSVLIVGSIGIDTITTPFGKEKGVLGGSASYSSVSARFFSPVNLVAVVGTDFPRKHRAFLEEKGIDLKGVITKKGRTFRWEGKYGHGFSGPKTLSTELNVSLDFNPTLPRGYVHTKYLFLANIDPEIQYNVLRQVKKPKLVVCDSMNYWIEHKRPQLCKLLREVDIFLCNEIEGQQLSGERNIVKAAKKLLTLGPKRVIIKKGEHGALLFSDHSVFCIPAFLLEIIFDPTGAGDTFAGGFIGYLAQCKKFTRAHLRKATVYGSIMAAFAVEDFSLRRLGGITKKDIAKRFKEFQKLTCF